MQVQIKRGDGLPGIILVFTEEDAMRKIKDEYPEAVDVPWEADGERLDPGGRPKGQRKLVYENQSTLGRKSRLIARIRKYR